MQRVFADTSYWIALLNPRDELHEKALSLSQHSFDQVITSEMVLVELLNAFSERGPHLRRAAAQVVDQLRRSGSVLIVRQGPEQFHDALEHYAEMTDKTWSLTDCASFLTMRMLSIEAALTYDKHFIQAGFEALLR